MPNATRSLTLPTGEEVLYDEADAHLVESRSWCRYAPPMGGHYVRARIDGAYRSLHRWLMGEPVGMDIDHINGNGLDNRRANLRVATHSQNMRNQRAQPGRTSRYKGVNWHGRWRVRIKTAGRSHHVGCFADEEAAAHAYDNAARTLFGEFAALNFPKPGERSALTGEIRPFVYGDGVEPCPGCGDPSCGDFGLCDCQWENYTPPAPAREPDVATNEIHKTYGIGGLIVDGDKVAELSEALGRAGWHSHRAAALALFKDGYTISEVAASIGVTPFIIASILVRGVSTSSVLEAEAMLRAKAPLTAVVTATGLSRASAGRLKLLLGVGATRRVYSEAQVAEAWTLRLRDKLTYVAIADAMGLKGKDSAVALLRRNACPADVAAAHVELVAA